MHLNKSSHLRDLYTHVTRPLKTKTSGKEKKTDSLPDLYLPMPCLPAPFSLCKGKKGLKHLKEC